MATISMTVISGAFNRTPPAANISSADAIRFLAALKDFYGQVPDGTFTNGVPNMRDRTNNEVVDAYFADCISFMLAHTLFQERKTAQKNSVDSIAQLTVT